VVGREEKYKAKNLIDVVIYRGSDALYGWVYDSLQALELKLGAIALCALPVVGGLAHSLNRARANAGTSYNEKRRRRSAEMPIRITHRDFAVLVGGPKSHCSNRHTSRSKTFGLVEGIV
jgi:hypothetical protein